MYPQYNVPAMSLLLLITLLAAPAITYAGDARKDCFDIGGHEYCNVTETWTPRISKTGGIAAIVAPTLLAAVPLSLNLYFMAAWTIKPAYNTNKGSEEYRKLWFIPCQLPQLLGNSIMVVTLICLPIFKTVWDVVDVAADSFYFQQLETGHLINTTITRNPHVNNAVMSFAVLGAIKSAVLGLFYMYIMSLHGEGVEEDAAAIASCTQVVVLMKIVLEDGPELLLEYFFVDRYVIDNQPWWLVAKDVITALIYMVPLLEMVKSARKDYLAVRDDEGEEDANHDGARYFILPALLSRILFSLTVVARLLGMVMQYTSGTIKEQCLQVTSEGTLIQTPFSVGCMDVCDWIIIVLLSAVLSCICSVFVHQVYIGITVIRKR